MKWKEKNKSKTHRKKKSLEMVTIVLKNFQQVLPGSMLVKAAKNHAVRATN